MLLKLYAEILKKTGVQSVHPVELQLCAIEALRPTHSYSLAHSILVKDKMAKDLTDRTYVRYDSGVTKIQDGEAENIQAIQGMFQKLLYGVFENKGERPAQRHDTFDTDNALCPGHTYPTTHARTLAIMKGKLVVSDDLPRHLKQSLFAKGGEYPLVVRHSTASQDVAMSVSQLEYELLDCNRSSCRTESQLHAQLLYGFSMLTASGFPRARATVRKTLSSIPESRSTIFPMRARPKKLSGCA